VFLRKHYDDPAMVKLRFNEPIGENDLRDLERIFKEEGTASEEVDTIRREGFGLFIRSLMGLDRESAKSALSTFTKGGNFTSNQMEFLNLVTNHLAARGWIEPRSLYSSPFTDLHPQGIDGLFNEEQTVALLTALASVRRNAIGPVTIQ